MPGHLLAQSRPRDPSLRSLADLSFAERLNFLLTNRIPRRWLTRLAGRLSKIENPLFARLAIRTWQWFVDDLRLYEAKKQTFSSLHDCFVRELRDGARPVDTELAVVTSPCDAIVGMTGIVQEQTVLQAKGYPYSIAELVRCPEQALRLEGARYVTLRLKSSMYHRFHAPLAGRVESVRYISGDTWNVNPIALKVIERLYCRNERAVIAIDAPPLQITLVAVAAVLVASMRIHGVDAPLNMDYQGPARLDVNRAVSKGEELGYFEHGSTIILFCSGDQVLDDAVRTGATIRMGEALLRLRPATAT